MWEVPTAVSGASEHSFVLVFEDAAGVEVQRRRSDTVAARAACQCGWRAGTALPVPSARPATATRASNAAEIDVVLEVGSERLRAAWWRTHLVEALPAVDLAAALPGLQIADAALTDAAASAWVDGASWAAIGAAAGVSKQAAHQRWSHATIAGPPRALAPARDGRPRRRVLPEPAGWPTLPGWSHPAPELADRHAPRSWGVTLAGRETVGVTAAAAYVGAGCSCGWADRSVPMPDVPRSRLGDALADLARHLFAPSWHRHLHQAAPTLRVQVQAERTAEEARALGELVAEARVRGATWSQIGDAVGMSGAGAADRWSDDPGRYRSPRAAARRPRRTAVLRSQART